MADDPANSDKETIQRLREALLSMNKEFMDTKLELDQLQHTAASPQNQNQNLKTDFSAAGAQFALKFSSKVRALQKNMNTKLATATSTKQLNVSGEDDDDVDDQCDSDPTTMDPHQNAATNQATAKDSKDAKDKEIRRLRDDIESLQTQMANVKQMLKQSMEEKDQMATERNALLIQYGEADDQIKRLKQQSNDDMDRYEQLLNSARKENESEIEQARKQIYKECDEKFANLTQTSEAYKEKLEGLQNKWDEHEREWNTKFDLVVSERNSLKRKVKSLQNDLSELMRNPPSSSGNHNHEQSVPHAQPVLAAPCHSNESASFGDEEELKMDNSNALEIERLKTEISTLNNSHHNEKTVLLSQIQQLSSKAAINSKTNDLQFLVNSLSNLISEKEDIISSLTNSKKYLGHSLLKREDEIEVLKQQLNK